MSKILNNIVMCISAHLDEEVLGLGVTLIMDKVF